MFVTLNANQPIRQELIYDQVTFRHPVYDGAALQAQKHDQAMNGQHNTWFCGAWMRNGFHEDGFASAVDVVQAMRAQPGAEQARADDQRRSDTVDHIAGTTFHGRRGGGGQPLQLPRRLCAAEPRTCAGPALFSRNRGNLTSVHDSRSWRAAQGRARRGLGAAGAGRSRIARGDRDLAVGPTAGVGACLQPGIILVVQRCQRLAGGDCRGIQHLWCSAIAICATATILPR